MTILEVVPLGAMTPLEFARRSKGYSQADLAEIALVHSNTICNAECGERQPGRTTRARLARALDVPEDLIFPDIEATAAA